ncbi:flippase [Streptococcus sp. NLN76]|uniref:flippase n=1 Tax=Streptococcus sp. NLN76 TaxID=2822800 RepID=UPI0018ABE189|nr:flippase [Streptococcus sp. NLN76]MBF8969898.1 flippase [Streptococcus sp. NLN76]
MKKEGSVRINFIMNFILTISNFLFPLITFPYISRVLGAAGVGTINFATSIVTYFSMVGMLGIPTYGIRACAKVRDDQKELSKTVQEIMSLNAIVMSLSILLYLITIMAVPQLRQEKLLYLILSSTLIFNVLGVDWLYKALERYSYITVRSIIFKFLSVLFMFLLVRSEQDYVVYGALTVFAAVGSNALNFINLRKIVDWVPLGELNIIRHLRPTLTFFLLTVSTTIYLNVDTTMLGFIKGSEEVGYYSAAVKVKQILVSVVTSLGAVLLPRLSYYVEQNREEEFKRLTKKALNFVIVLSFPLVVYFILMSHQAILFLSGPEFLPATLPMQLIMPTVLFIGLSNLMGIQILVPTHREKLVVYSTMIGALVDILINLVGIPFFGAAGAAFASMIAEFSVVLVQILFLKDFIIPLFKEIQSLKILFALIISTAFTSICLGMFDLSNFLTLLVSSVVYFSVYLVMLIVLKENFIFDMIHSSLKKVGNI